MSKILKKQSVVLVDFNPIKGHEQSGIRPALVVSGNDFHYSGLCFVCPLTTKIKNLFGNLQITPNSENGLTEKSEVLIGQIRTIDQNRILKVLGKITEEEIQQLFWGLDRLMDR